MCVGNFPIEFKFYIIPMQILWIKGGLNVFLYLEDVTSISITCVFDSWEVDEEETR
jgi:hypothetical protein